MLNFCDFSRFAPDQKTVRRGNFWGLPINSTAFALLSVIVTAGSMQVFGEAITDPAALLAKVHNTPVLIVGALTFAIATMGVNIVANFVSPAYDLANIWPKRITFTIGGMISAVAALCVPPWKLYSSPTVVNYFLGGLGAFLGPLFGIMIVDYYLIRRGKVDVDQLFVDGGSYPRVNPARLRDLLPDRRPRRGDRAGAVLRAGRAVLLVHRHGVLGAPVLRRCRGSIDEDRRHQLQHHARR